MKIPSEPISAFSIYSKQLKQKKTPKKHLSNLLSKMKKPGFKIDDLNAIEVNKINKIIDKYDEKSTIDGKDDSNKITIGKLKVNTTNLPKKVQGKIKNKFLDEKIKKKSIHKNTKNVQSNKSKTLTQKPGKNLINEVLEDIDEKKFEESRKNEVFSVPPKRDRQNLLPKKRKKNLTKHENENKISNKVMSKERFKTSKNEVAFKVKKKQEKRLGSDWTSQHNSILAAKRLFEWLILPITEKDFKNDYWEKKPLLIQREGNRNYFSELISTLEIDSMIRKNNVQFTKHLDVTSYTDQKRETHNLTGRAHTNVVWDFYTNGCSVRLLNPQVFLPKIHNLNATLQGYFGCFVGANVYLTPPNSQGFAPHYDDIEAFVLQIEGKKHWKVYKPRSDGEILPRYSSPNFTQEEIGDPILDVTLEPGDMLYFPRGFIHQASTVEGEHSLHITLSAYQKTSWVDLLEKAIPIALERAAAEDVEFRKGLPRDYLGIEFHGSDATRVSFTSTAQRLMSRVAYYLQLSLGAGVDKMGAQFMHDALPPVFTPDEKQNMVLGSGLKMKDKGTLSGRVEFQMETEIKLVRANICRLVEEENELRLYHCLDNPLEYHADEPQFLVLPLEGAQVITQLSILYPAFVQLQALPHRDKDTLLTMISDLWDAGLLLTKRLPTVEED